MERSLQPGIPSSKLIRDQSDATAALASLLEQPALKTIIHALMPAELFVVGGTVRDAFYGESNTDLDLATNLQAPEIKARCTQHGIRTVDTGIQHGTILAVVDETHIEITTFRQPSERDMHTPARDIATDLSGRDFTINAVAFDVFSEKLVDPLGGIRDIEQNYLRTAGDSTSRLTEDPLRILRMVRFGPAQGRSVDPDLLAAATHLVDTLSRVSVERIRVELQAILMSPLPHAGFICIKEIGALPYTTPELIPAIGFEQNRFHIHDVFEHTMWVLERSSADPVLRWSALFHDIGKPHTLSVDELGNRHFYQHEVVSEKLARERMHTLRFSRDDTDTIASIVRHHMRPLDCGAPGVRRLIRDLGDNLPRWRKFKEADAPPVMPEDEFAATAQAFDALLKVEEDRRAGPAYGKLAVTGEDLIGIGIKPGPGMGTILKELEEIVLDDPSANERERLLAEALKRRR
jgi:tRNA nucleotidyltransferase (CCA-adding enzyme)